MSPSPSLSPSPTTSSAAAVALGPQGGTAGGGSGTATPFDAGGLVGVATHPVIVWSMTTTGGLLLFLFLLRQSREDDDLRVTEELALAASATGPLAARGRDADRTPEVSPSRPTGRATMLPPVPPRVFEKPPARDAERAKIGYRRVRISSKPDSVRSLELGRLDRGDEVEIVNSYEGFLQVRTPDGITGWILRHTIVGAPD